MKLLHINHSNCAQTWSVLLDLELRLFCQTLLNLFLKMKYSIWINTFQQNISVFGMYLKNKHWQWVFSLLTFFFQILTNAQLVPTTVHLDRPAITYREASDASPLTALPITRRCQTRESYLSLSIFKISHFNMLFLSDFVSDLVTVQSS